MDKEIDSLAGWNSVNDTRPDFGVKVMVYNSHFGVQIAYLKPNRNGTTSWIVNDDPMLNITHWCPIPEIPPSARH
jgi:hypothetical protein